MLLRDGCREAVQDLLQGEAPLGVQGAPPPPHLHPLHAQHLHHALVNHSTRLHNITTGWGAFNHQLLRAVSAQSLKIVKKCVPDTWLVCHKLAISVKPLNYPLWATT